MGKVKTPNTKASRVSGKGKGFGGMGGGLASSVAGAFGVLGIASMLEKLGLPPISEMLSNPMYLGAGALGLFLLLK